MLEVVKNESKNKEEALNKCLEEVLAENPTFSIKDLTINGEDVMKYMMENAHLYPTLEMADNALSRYIAQKGKCAVTHTALSVSDMVCVHIKPCKGERNDTYRNLIILSKDVSEVVRATNLVKIGKLLADLHLTEEMKEKINKLRKHRELEEIQFEDYIGTKK